MENPTPGTFERRDPPVMLRYRVTWYYCAVMLTVLILLELLRW